MTLAQLTLLAEASAKAHGTDETTPRGPAAGARPPAPETTETWDLHELASWAR